jgi:hypothetical protein
MSRKYASSHEHLHQASRSLFWLLYRRFKSSPPQRREKLSKIDLLSRTSATLRKILTVCTAFSVQNFSAWPAGLVESPRIFMSHRVNPCPPDGTVTWAASVRQPSKPPVQGDEASTKCWEVQLQPQMVIRFP